MLVVIFGAALPVFVAERYWIVAEGARTLGKVTRVTSENASCRSGRRFRLRSSVGRYRPCTRYRALVHYEVAAGYYVIEVTAGSARGRDQPLSLARYAKGDRVPVVYRPMAPGSALRDEPWDVWGVPLATFLFLVAFIYGLFSRRVLDAGT